MKRRGFLSGTAFTTAAFVEPALFALTAPPMASAAGAARDAGHRRIGITDVEILTGNVAHLRRMDRRFGAGRIRQQAVQLLHQAATTLLPGSYSDSTGRALLTAVAIREGMLIQGPAGWGEFCPFREYDDREAASWLATAVEAATSGWPEPVRDRVPVNCTVPAGRPATRPRDRGRLRVPHGEGQGR